jgi:hypothetical protein
MTPLPGQNISKIYENLTGRFYAIGPSGSAAFEGLTDPGFSSTAMAQARELRLNDLGNLAYNFLPKLQELGDSLEALDKLIIAGCWGAVHALKMIRVSGDRVMFPRLRDVTIFDDTLLDPVELATCL